MKRVKEIHLGPYIVKGTDDLSVARKAIDKALGVDSFAYSRSRSADVSIEDRDIVVSISSQFFDGQPLVHSLKKKDGSVIHFPRYQSR